MSEQPPPTIIVVHPKERRSKCTVEPLRGRAEFVFWKYPECNPAALGNYVRLGIGGPELSADDASHGLLVLDGTWRYADAMAADYESLPLRSLPPWKTAYPRKSKLFDDPDRGLATIEAVYAAHQVLGRNTTGLLDGYFWAREFLEANDFDP